MFFSVSTSRYFSILFLLDSEEWNWSTPTSFLDWKWNMKGCKTPKIVRDIKKPGLPRWFSAKESTCNAGEFNPWIEKIPWSRKWQPTPILFLGESHRQRNLVGYSLRGCKKGGHDLATKQKHKPRIRERRFDISGWNNFFIKWESYFRELT